MLPLKDGTPGHCGPILYRYSCYQAVRDKVCRDFKVLIMFYKDQEKSIGRGNSNGSNGGAASGGARGSNQPSTAAAAGVAGRAVGAAAAAARS